jgi:dolichol-phosphate mannosyltransferase
VTGGNAATHAPALSVVVPVYGCADCLEALCARVAAALAGTDYELVLVDDRSEDGAWSLVADLATRYPIAAIRLSRNFGQQAAITAGLAEARGPWVVVMDCDLQDRPEELPRLIAKAAEGYDVVFGRRTSRRHSRFRRSMSRLYFALLNTSLRTDLAGEFGSFSILSRKVVDAYLTLGDTSRHYVFIVQWLGFEQTAIDVDHAERHSGRSSYSLRRLMRHALDGVLFQTTVLLQWIVYLGFALAVLGMALAAVLVGIAVFSTPPPGWTSLAVLILLIGGFIIISTGVAGLYVGKIFDQVKGRPLFVVDERIGRGPVTQSGPASSPDP